MRGARLCAGFIVVLSALVFAESNLRITDVGLHGYWGTPLPVRLHVRNPSSQRQLIHLQVGVVTSWGITNTVSSEVSLPGGDERELELPIAMPSNYNKITAEASAADGILGHDTYDRAPRHTNLIALMCADDAICKTVQSQIEFSGSVNDRADKNRNAAFEVVNDPREDWWAYSAANAIVLATPVKKFTGEQRTALEGYLRRGGRLVLVDQEIADPDFLSAYRIEHAPGNGEHVGKGALFRVSSVNTLGEVFAGPNLAGFLQQQTNVWELSGRGNWMGTRFATVFKFPRLRWMLVWLAVYIIVIGILNFGVLRRVRKLELGWISTCVLALIFAAGFYYSGASRRPREFRVDVLPIYYLDGRSPVAAADYGMRVSTPERRDVSVSVNDPAVFVETNLNFPEPHSQIWTEMNRPGAVLADRELKISLGPATVVELPLLKWSFRDLSLEGLHQLPGTVHFVGVNRLRNDTGQELIDGVYVDYDAGHVFDIPVLRAGEEIQLDTMKAKAIPKDEQRALGYANLDQAKAPLRDLVLAGYLPEGRHQGRVFAAFSDGPALPVELNVPHRSNVHSLIVVALEQP